MTMAEDRFGARAELPGGLAYYRLDALAQRGRRRRLAAADDREDPARRTCSATPATASSPTTTWPPSPAGTAGLPEHDRELPYFPARVLLQDFTGVPPWSIWRRCARALRPAGGDPSRIDPLVPADLVIDHSVQVDAFGNRGRIRRNLAREYQRNREPYSLLRWARRPSAASGSSPRDGDRPPDQPRVPGAGCARPRRRAGSAARCPTPWWYRRPDPDGQRPGRPWLGRGRDRGRGRYARSAALPAPPRCGRGRFHNARPAGGHRD